MTDSERLQVVLTKESAGQSWGFRLQGGADFTTPLSVQSVTPGGLAERCGLRAGDAVLSLNERPSDELEHDVAKSMIVSSGNEVRLAVQRGAVKVWQPKVTPLAQLRPGQVRPSADLNGPDPYVQKTSLAADKQEYKPIGSAHNRSARPFPAFGGGGAGGAPPVQQQAPPPQAPAASHWDAPASAQQYAPPPAVNQQSYAPPPAVNQQSYAPPPAVNQQSFAPPPPASSFGGANLSSNLANLQVRESNTAAAPTGPKPFAPQVLITSDDSSTHAHTSTNNNNKTPAFNLQSHTAAPVSPSYKMIQDYENDEHPHKRPVSPMFAALERATGSSEVPSEVPSVLSPVNRGTPIGAGGGGGGSHLRVAEQAQRSLSPTMLLIQEEEEKQRRQQGGSGVVAIEREAEKPAPPIHSPSHLGTSPHSAHHRATSPARFHEQKGDEEYPHYEGYMDHSKQSRSFKILQAGVEAEEEYYRTHTDEAVPKTITTTTTEIIQPTAVHTMPSGQQDLGTSPRSSAQRVDSPARFKEQGEGQDYPKYQGYMDHSKQSRSFKVLQAEVDDGSPGTGAALPSGMRSVRAPLAKPPGEKKQESQYMTCKVCNTLCVGVFVRVKGEPMHPECYKCVSCGLSLKNQGFYTIAEKLYCSNCAQRAHEASGGQQAQTVYR